jgi:uncharacterized damage-inducible protein DinB
MSIAESVLPEFDNEMATTRVMLARAPEDKAGWKPHPKSYSLGDLVTHLANLPSWTPLTLNETELDLNPPGGPAWTPPTYQGREACLATFDRNVSQARECIAKTSDAEFLVPWTLKSGGQVAFSLPRVVVLRSFVLNHVIHHRGQLSVYLRLNEVPLPSVYGPTADEAPL